MWFSLVGMYELSTRKESRSGALISHHSYYVPVASVWISPCFPMLIAFDLYQTARGSCSRLADVMKSFLELSDVQHEGYLGRREEVAY